MKLILDSILTGAVQNFIASHGDADVERLLLKQGSFNGVPMQWIAWQITGNNKAKAKLPGWHRRKGIVYPPTINMEQCSSEATAKFKLHLLQSLTSAVHTAGRGADLTGGFGVDAYYLSKHASQMDYVEPNEDILRIAAHNHHRMGAENIVHHHSTAESFLAGQNEKYDFIYIDPSRRKLSQKVYRLADCEPDLVSLLPAMFERSAHILVKASPMHDLQQGCRELQHVIQVIVVAVENECKELLFLLQKDFTNEPTIRAVDLDKHGEVIHSLSFTMEEERDGVPIYSKPLTYLYEPDASILKAGAFKYISRKYGLLKLAPNTHLYTSENRIRFPGRIFRVSAHVKLGKNLKELFHDGYACILTRNYPLNVEEIKKKTGLKEGGRHFLICTQTQNEKFVMTAEQCMTLPEHKLIPYPR